MVSLRDSAPPRPMPRHESPSYHETHHNLLTSFATHKPLRARPGFPGSPRRRSENQRLRDVFRWKLRHRAPEGTNDREIIYDLGAGIDVRHGSVRIYRNRLCYYLMEQNTGSAQPTYLQIYLLVPDEEKPMLLTGKTDQASGTIRLFLYSHSGYY